MLLTLELIRTGQSLLSKNLFMFSNLAHVKNSPLIYLPKLSPQRNLSFTISITTMDTYDMHAISEATQIWEHLFGSHPCRVICQSKTHETSEEILIVNTFWESCRSPGEDLVKISTLYITLNKMKYPNTDAIINRINAIYRENFINIIKDHDSGYHTH